MAVAPSTRSSVADAIGGFTREVFTNHLASLSGAPDWWVERKRSAYARFESLPMPSRTDEGWRFSNISGISLAGFSPATPDMTGAGMKLKQSLVTPAATLTFVGGRFARGTPVSDELAGRGVVISTLSEAISKHPERLREHFMAQPQKLGSAKFAALHEAFVQDGAFIFVPKGWR